MPYTIRRVAGEQETLRALHTLTFPDDEHADYAVGEWWLALNEGGDPVGFAGSAPARTEPRARYLVRCGVLAGHRGHGLQRRLLATRVRHARAAGSRAVITTTYENPPSGNNLIRAGFRLYTPQTPWCGEGTNYWRLDLLTP